MLKIYCCAGVRTLPGEREGLAYSLLEGAGCRKPLLSTDIPGVKMILSPGVEGLTFPVGNRAALLECMSRLKNNQGIRQVYGRNACARAALYDRTLVLRSFLVFFRDTIRGMSA